MTILGPVYIAALSTETNTFSPTPTGWSAFEEVGIHLDGSTNGLELGMAAFRRRAEADGRVVHEGITAFAQPAGRTVRVVWEDLRDRILEGLRKAGPVSAVLLSLHGAMVADGSDDCEGELLTRVRATVPGAVVGALLDPHCHLTATMVGAADVLVTYREYPHTDIGDRGEDLYELCARVERGEIRPVPALVDTACIGFYPTQDQPMRSIVEEIAAASRHPRILSASLAHGFPWGDVPDVGTRFLVYADADADAAAAEALRLSALLYGKRHALLPRYPDVAQSLDRAAGLRGRVVLGDYADNPGGGAPGDSTFILREMLRRGLADAVVGSFHDPQVVSMCADAGPGAELTVRLGGKAGPSSGDPLDLDVQVVSVVRDHQQNAFGSRQPMGTTAWLRHGGIDIVASALRAQVYSRDLFTGLGLDLMDRRLIVVKSSNHFVADFAPIADHLWQVSSPGALDTDRSRLPYRRRDLDFFPRIDDPWTVNGGPSLIPLPKYAR